MGEQFDSYGRGRKIKLYQPRHMKPWTKESEERDRTVVKPSEQNSEKENMCGIEEPSRYKRVRPDETRVAEEGERVERNWLAYGRTPQTGNFENSREIEERLSHSSEEASKSAGELLGVLEEMSPRTVQRRGRPSKKSLKDGTYPNPKK